MKMLINSKTHGEHTVYFDDEDLELIKQYKWGIWKSKTGKLYAFHSWKRDGEEVSIKMHRLVMGVEHNRLPLIDHRNGNTLNNKKSNLRIVTHSQNSMNRGKTVKNKSGFKGVTKKSKNRYVAVISVRGHSYRGGTFSNPIDAATKYDEMAKKYHGEFANLNFPSTNKTKEDENDKIYVQPICERKRQNSTGFRGVCKIDGSVKNKYRAYINYNRRRESLGCFSDPVLAAKVYDARAKEIHGSKAVLNFLS